MVCIVPVTRIEPCNAFKLVVCCSKYNANLEFVMVQMDEQRHVLWFVDAMASKIIWASTQTLAVWAVENDVEWKLTSNDQFEEMVKDRLAHNFAKYCSRSG